MTIAACIVYVLIVLAVLAWLLYEIHLDTKYRNQYREPTNRDRLPPL